MLILRKLCCPGLQRYLEQRAGSERVSRGAEEGQEQEADLHGKGSERCGDQIQGWGLRMQRLGHLHHGLGSASCYLRHSGLR